MADQAPVSTQELVISSLAQTDALAKLLIERGLIGKEEYMAKILEERPVYQRMLNPQSTEMLQMLNMDHHRIPYCRPDHGEHTELIYGTEDEGECTLRYVVLSWRGGELIRFAEEPDAAAKTGTSGMNPYPRAWLVT